MKRTRIRTKEYSSNVYTCNMYVFFIRNQIITDAPVTKYLLLLSVTLSYSYVIVTSYQSILMWINISSFEANIWCPAIVSYRWFSYIAGRTILYSYFIYRTNDIFNGTYLEFSKCSKYSLVTWCPICVCTLVIPASYIFSMQDWSIGTDTNGNGTFCVSDDANANYIQYLFVYGSLNDLLFSFITILMMVSRLFLLLTDNERKKSKTRKYTYRQSRAPSVQQQTETVTSAPDSVANSPQQSPRGTPRGGQTPQMFPETPELARMDSQASLQQNGSQENHQILHVTTLSMERSKSRSFDGNETDSAPKRKNLKKSKSKTKLEKRVSRMDAIQFHDKTHDHNALVLLMSKFFLILSTVVLSTQFMLVMLIISRDYVTILYSIDTIINIICLYLTFNFSDDYYNKYFCGRCCTKCCFPCIKAVALSCSEYSVTYQQTHNMNNCCVGSKCCIYSRCFCFSSCRYFCCWSSDATPKEIYALAKFEIELMVASNEEKSLTMRTMSRSSQKDAMMSQTNNKVIEKSESRDSKEKSENSTRV